MTGVGVAQICALLRYTLLTRLLGPEQLGLAVTLILTAQFFESISDSGSDRFLVQDLHGDEPRTQGLVQLVSVVRGFAIAGALLIFAAPIASFYREPGLVAGLMWLGAAPLIAGFLHFDVRRAQRHNDFHREGLCMITAEIVSLGVTVAVAVATHSYVAALAGLITRALALVAVSHLTAERRYAVGYAAEYAPRLTAFAAPLMINGLVLFLSGQGDRVLVGNQLGVVELGRYSAVLLLIYYPSMALQRYFHAMKMPAIVAARISPAALARGVDEMASEALLLALGMIAGFALVAPVAIPLLFGERFAQPVTIVALIGTIQVWRFIRVWPTTSALALGHSRVVLAGNVIRLIAYPAAIMGAWQIGGLLGLTLGFAIGEVVSVVITVAMTNRVIGMPIGRDADRLVALAAGCTTVIGAAWGLDAHRPALALAVCVGATMLLAAIMWYERATLRQILSNLAEWRMRRAGRLRA